MPYNKLIEKLKTNCNTKIKKQHEIQSTSYSPYIYSNDIFDFWIADTIGNFTGTIAIIFFDIAGFNPLYKKGRIFLIIITLGLIVNELVQYILPGTNTCDWKDIIATLIAGLISWGIYELVNKKLYAIFKTAKCELIEI